MRLHYQKADQETIQENFVPNRLPQIPLTIKEVEYGDMQIVAKLICSSADWYRKFVDPKDMEEHFVGKSWIDKNFFRREFYLGYSNKQAVGTISYQTMGSYAYLGYIYLDAEQVGKGFGHRLIDHAKSIAKKRGMRGMILIAHPKARWAMKAYQKYGFMYKFTRKEDILGFQNGCLKDYYEEGFVLLQYDFKLMGERVASSN